MRIDSLTPEQQGRMKEWADKWVKIGLSTEPADFDKATEAALKAYGLCNLGKPMVVLRMGSPYAATVGGTMAWVMLKAFSKTKNGVGAQVRDQVRAQVRDQVRDQVRAQVRDQVRAQVRDQVRAQVRAQVGDQVWDQVRAQVWDQVRDQVWAQVRAQVWDQVWAQVRAQVGDQVWAQVRDQVRDQVWDQVRDQVRDQVWDQVRAQVWDQVRDQVWAQVRAQVWDQVWDQVRAQVGDQVWAQVWAESFQAAKDGMNNDGASSILWAGYAAWVSFFRDVCDWKNEKLKNFEIAEDLVNSCGWTWWHQNVLAISDRPAHIKRDEQGRLHCEDGPSIKYRDGWSLFHWHGVSIPEYWVSGTPPSPKEALTWENVEQRRAACEIVGWFKVLESSELNSKIIDQDEPHIGTLIQIDLPDAPAQWFLKYRCGTGRWFAESVNDKSFNTALKANAGGNGWRGVGDPLDFIPFARS